MTLMGNIIAHNTQFVATKQYEQFATDKYPDKKMVIITCMDTRLVELLPRAMNLRNGDAKIVKTAGAIVSHPFGSVMRSIIVAIYELSATEVFVVGHHDCGMTSLNTDHVMEKAIERGISSEVIETIQHAGINLTRWLQGFEHVREGVESSVNTIRNHPLLPKSIPVHGLIMDPATGKLDIVSSGYEKS